MSSAAVINSKDDELQNRRFPPRCYHPVLHNSSYAVSRSQSATSLLITVASDSQSGVAVRGRFYFPDIQSLRLPQSPRMLFTLIFLRQGKGAAR